MNLKTAHIAKMRWMVGQEQRVGVTHPTIKYLD